MGIGKKYLYENWNKILVWKIGNIYRCGKWGKNIYMKINVRMRNENKVSVREMERIEC